MFYQLSFETHCNFDQPIIHAEPELKQSSLPTTAHNSPGSVKSLESFQAELQHSCDISFEAGTQINHANNIWNASVDMLNNSMVGPVNQETAFNNNHLYKYSSFACDTQFKSVDEAIKSNRLLRYYEKVNFIEQLQKEAELCGLLVELMTFFNAKIFGELVYIVHTVWNQKYLAFRQQKNKKANPVIPKFSCFFGFEDEEVEMDDMNIQDKDNAEIISKAQENIEDLARELFNSKKLKYLNFQEIRGEKKSGHLLRGQFELFIKAVSKAVFLSAEGVYEEEEVSVGSFSEEEEGLFGCNGNRFVRAYSQISQEDDEFAEPACTKRQKLF